ncbi:MAG: response regulator transcription factor [Erysipelotrichaceae bacterium]|nr:response regulator transcription factor [Erysipelotrichaceae bacterium]MCI9524425.1 response regulator transcription factor [Erysipelotrichaceae bacterium]
MKTKLLIVDDEYMITALLQDHFQDEGYDVYVANSALEATQYLDHPIDLILLDVNMSEMDGFAFLKTIRSHIQCPILFLTACIQEQDVIHGLEFGGDDYITKPFRLQELSARVASHIRREKRINKQASILTSQELLVNVTQRKVFYRNVEIPFSKTEFDIIEFLLMHANQVFDKERIYECVWGYDKEGNADVIKEHIRKIRAKLLKQTGSTFIETVWGVGYTWRR